MSNPLKDDFTWNVHPFVLKTTNYPTEDNFILYSVLPKICAKAIEGDPHALRWLEDHGLLTFEKRLPNAGLAGRKG